MDPWAQKNAELGDEKTDTSDSEKDYDAFSFDSDDLLDQSEW
jgi:hypothetical protein